MLKDLISLANDLDKKGLRKEADYLDRIIKRYAEENQQVGSSGMTALKNYIDSLYLYSKISYSVSSKEKDKTIYSVTDYDDRHHKHMKGLAESGEKIEHSGKTFMLSLEGDSIVASYGASGGYKQHSSYQIEIKKPTAEEKEDRFGNVITSYKTEFVAKKL